MFWIDLLFVLLFAILLTSILSAGLGWRHPRSPGFAPALIFLFVVLLLGMWAGGLWIVPVGPLLWDVPWLTFLLVGLLVALLILAAAAPATRPRPRTPTEAAEETEEAVIAGTVFTAFFWVLVIGLLIAIVVGYTT